MIGRLTKLFLVIATLLFFTSCVSAVKVPIVNPKIIEENKAKAIFLSKYVNFMADLDVYSVGKDWRGGHWACQEIKNGKYPLSGVKASKNGQYTMALFLKGKNFYKALLFAFNDGARLTRTCYPSYNYCQIWIKDGAGYVQAGNMSTVRYEPKVEETGITCDLSDDSYSHMLFTYPDKLKDQADELISLFLSAFPILQYE